MITFLAFLYIFSAFAYFYANKSGYSLLRYIWNRENINIYLLTEIVFSDNNFIDCFYKSATQLDSCYFNVHAPSGHSLACWKP